jgi:hypothetical protein
VNKRDAWWKFVVDAKFGSAWDGWYSFDPSGSHGLGLWKNIRRGCSSVFSHTRFELGDGSRIRFWEDVWCGELALKEAFPILDNLAHVKDVSVAVNLDFSSDSGQWNVSFIRSTHDWEVDVLASFYSLLYSHRVGRKGKIHFGGFRLVK